MFDFRSLFGALRRHAGAAAIVIVVVVVFAGGTIVGIYNRVRARVPVLPAARS